MQLIGSSLLFVHDSQKADVWLIDFGKTVPVPEDLSINHRTPWEVGNHEDGYLIGIENLIELFGELASRNTLATTSAANSMSTSSSSSSVKTQPPETGSSSAD